MTQINDIRPVDFSTGNKIVIRVENLWKQYRLGSINHGTLARDLQSWWARVRGRDDPNRMIFQAGYTPKTSSSGYIASNVASSGHFWALHDVSFDVEQGEILGVIGQNGAGKSTLLKILSQVTTPSKGQIKIKGRTASLLEVGTGFHPELTGLENIFLNGAILGMNKQEINRKLEEIISFAEIDRFVDTPVKRYSSGMYVRLAFAVAAHLEPEILVVDEVLAVGDSAFQKKCLGKMEAVVKEGRTVLFVSHNLTAVDGLCQTGIVLHNGKCLFKGSTATAIREYENLYKGRESANLENRTDRTGNQKAKCLSVKMFNKDGIETNIIEMGTSLSVEILVDGKLSNAVVAVLIGNVYRTQMIRAHSRETYSGKIDINGRKIIKCTFDDFPMMHGTYDVHVWVGRKGEVADYVENVAELIVSPRDIFGTGVMLDPNGGVAFASISWEVV